MLIQYLFSQPAIFVAFLAAIVLALAFHEYAHAYLAYRLGDTTAADAGRLTLNPLAHLDLVGTLCLVLVGFGWGKPVPVNEGNLRNRRWGGLWVSLAGPLSNVALALAVGAVSRLLGSSVGELVAVFFVFFAGINLVLAAFNLLPVPPLDGSSILFSLLPYRFRGLETQLRRNGLWIILGLVLVFNVANWNPFGGLYDLGQWLVGYST